MHERWTFNKPDCISDIHVISYMRKTISSDIQTWRSELTNEAIAKFFNQLQGVWISGET